MLLYRTRHMGRKKGKKLGKWREGEKERPTPRENGPTTILRLPNQQRSLYAMNTNLLLLVWVATFALNRNTDEARQNVAKILHAVFFWWGMYVIFLHSTHTKSAKMQPKLVANFGHFEMCNFATSWSGFAEMSADRCW